MSDTDTGVTEQCPSCGVEGKKTPRVGTFECETRACRVKFYQRADEHHDVAVGAPRSIGTGTDHD